MGRPRLHDESVRDSLLDAAARALERDGPAAVSVRRLSESVGTSTAAVYTLFGSKRGLLEALDARAFARLRRTQEQVVATDLAADADPLATVVRLGLAYRGVAIADPVAYRRIFGPDAPPDPGPDVGAEAVASFAPLLETVTTAVGRGLLPREPEAYLIAMSCWANVHGLVTLELSGFRPPGAPDPGGFVELALAAHVRGWATGVTDG